MATEQATGPGRQKGDVLLDIRGLHIDGFSNDRWHQIVKGIDLTVRRGEVVGLIGESGAGKSSLGLAAMGYTKPGLKITDKRVIPDFAREIFAGRDLVMFSDGTPTRTFCYSADSITGYYKVLVRGHVGEPYNIGTEKPDENHGNRIDEHLPVAKSPAAKETEAVLRKLIAEALA